MKALFYRTCEGNVCHPEKALTKYGEIVRKYALTGNIPHAAGATIPLPHHRQNIFFNQSIIQKPK
ncbi:MAG: hypothetical protein LBL04_04615 [Bacteroidales bacterium]|jgi:hypothetical protein|nr:hypothetical protein [Bacteroidales bacterium]